MWLARLLNLGLHNGAVDAHSLEKPERKAFGAVPRVVGNALEYAGWKLVEVYGRQASKLWQVVDAMVAQVRF